MADPSSSGDGDGDPGTTSGDGDGDPGTSSGDGDGDGDPGETISVSGDAFQFGPYTMIANAAISVLELPAFTTTTDDAGHWTLDGLPPGADATFVLVKDGFPRTQTKTFALPETGSIERISFQVPDDATFGALAQIVGIEPDPATCQFATTVTRVGKSVYDEGAHGEAGATVSLAPAVDAVHGPVYFNAQVIPQADLSETSEDGGVLYTNLAPGSYTLTGTKPDVSFEEVRITCEPGVLVNASPPFGVQAL